MQTISQALLTFLLNAGWQIALITLTAALCAWLLRGTAARYRHLLWVIALASSVGLPLLTSVYLLDSKPSEPARAQVTTQGADAGSFSATKLILADTPSTELTPLRQAGQFVPISRNMAALIVVFYLLLLGYRSGQLLMAWRRTRAIAGSAYPVELPASVQSVIDECQAALGISRVRVMCSTSVAVPITVGIRAPLVILPERLLQEAERAVLTSAIGHELVHVLRRDYLLNLFYELIALPLAFHPATALLRRRIRETRELGCDEVVTDRLLEPAIYARSLVQLASAAITVGRPTATITVGIADADILEERVMTILNRPKLSLRRKNLLLAAAALVFIVPCVVAMPFALRININTQDAVATPRQSLSVEAGTMTTWMKRVGEAVERGEVIAEMKTDRGVVKVEANTSGVIERLLVQRGENVTAGVALALIRPPAQTASEAVVPAQQEERAREERRKREIEMLRQKVAELESLPEKQGATLTQEEEAKLKEELRALGILKQRQPITQEEEAKLKEDMRFLEKRLAELKRAEHEGGGAKFQEREFEARRLAQQLEREVRAKRQSELAKEAKVTMQQAIQIATSQQPGTVMECRLIGEKLVGERDTVLYVVTVLSSNETESTTTRVVISAIDGRVVKTLKDER
jgi:beta-lactamase regulating signal transducer with metallopeptidase domain/uncharacterized membrane protein YkoI